jgi:hypothetical protein
MDENTPEVQDQNTPNQPEHSPKIWRACCLVPTLAAALVLIIAIGASLHSPMSRGLGNKPAQPADASTQARREAFIGFGKKYFAIAMKADEVNRVAFDTLQAMVQGGGTLDQVHSAFRRAAGANARAAAELNALGIPASLKSQDKLKRSIDSISQSFAVRHDVCVLLVQWNGDTKDQATASRYNSMGEKINKLTEDGLNYLGEAAKDNQLTSDDVRRFVPEQVRQSMQLNALPWQPQPKTRFDRPSLPWSLRGNRGR